MSNDLKERLECSSYAVKEDGDVDDSLLSEALARIQQLEADLEKARAFISLCQDGFSIADDELKGSAAATLKEIYR